MSKWTRWATLAGYIVTANDDGTIPVNAKIAAHLDPADIVGPGHYAQMLIDQANAAPEVADLLRRIVNSDMAMMAEDEGRTCRVLTEARELLKRIGG